MNRQMAVALLTGGGDHPYVFGLTTVLLPKDVDIDLIGSDELDLPEFRGKPGLTFLNLRGDVRTDAGYLHKIIRVIVYYARLFRYAAIAKPRIFHILWNNKFETLDRTLLMLYYRWLGKKIVFTAHNVNKATRDSNDTALNRLTLRIQYRLSDHIFVHTQKMKYELIQAMRVPEEKITVIPFGINNAVPYTSLTPEEARLRLGIRPEHKVLLFFGRIVPYKGLEYLVDAFRQRMACDENCRLIIAGKPREDCLNYWAPIKEGLRPEIEAGRVLLRADFIPNDETEVYFKAADALVLPYRYIYQSGVLFLAHSFGLPVLAADVGSLKDDIVEGSTGFVFRPEDTKDLAKTIDRYFSSDLYARLDMRRPNIREHAIEAHSWDKVAELTLSVYLDLLGRTSSPVEVRGFAPNHAETSIEE